MRPDGLTLRQRTLRISGALSGRAARPFIQVRVYIKTFDALKWPEHGRQEQFCDPLVPADTYWYLSASPELGELVAGRLDDGPGGVGL